MTLKKENSGGKKFHGRQPNEKRVKVSAKKTEAKFKKKFHDKPIDRDNKDKSKPAFKSKQSYFESENKRGFKPFDKKGANDRKGGRKGGKDAKFLNTDSGNFDGKRKVFKKERPEKSGKKLKPDNFKGPGKMYKKTSENLQKGQKLVEGEVRLNRFIANSGMCSRREADVMIQQGLVVINGVAVTELGTKVKPGDDVRVDGKRIYPEKPVYILLNKPKGFITSTTDPRERSTVMDLIDLQGKERIYPVGRLDRNTTGVLLLTNDGDLAQKLMHPSFEIKKIYKATLNAKPAKEHMLAWVNGVELEDGYMSFEQIGFVDEEDPTILGLEVHSGRNRIVRRMFEHFGYEVVALDRVMLGEFDHLKLGRGKWRFLNEKEVRYVEQLKRMKSKKLKH